MAATEEADVHGVTGLAQPLSAVAHNVFVETSAQVRYCRFFFFFFFTDCLSPVL
jgi:hypothetical protein